jgi:hypothetical protein
VGRATALLILLAALWAWYEAAPHIHRLSLWHEVAVVGIVLMPAVFALAWLALPFRESPLVPMLVTAAVLVAAAIGLGLAHFDVASNFAKFAALTTIAWIFLRVFEGLYLVALVACIIPFVDAYSVWRGPTRSITNNHPSLFTKLSIEFVVPSDRPARLGLPDVMFFALFLGATARFGLRTGWTWLTMCIGLGATIALTTYWSNGGLPALPAISIGFLLPNIDLIWTRVRRELAGQRADVAPDG